jgi:hypothetical protein
VATVETRAYRDGLKAQLVRLDTATRRAAGYAASLVERDTKIRLATYSHPPGTPTPSPVGEPPAWVTGSLARSVEAEPPRPEGRWVWTARVGPTIVYGRIQELGGWAGMGGRTYVPPRPYLGPTVGALTAEDRIRDQFITQWRGVLGHA